MKRMLCAVFALVLCMMFQPALAETLTLEEVQALGSGWFVMEGDCFTELEKCVMTDSKRLVGYSNDVLLVTEDDPESYIMEIDRRQHVLVYLQETRVPKVEKVAPIESTMYCYPVIYMADDVSGYKLLESHTNQDGSVVECVEVWSDNCQMDAVKVGATAAGEAVYFNFLVAPQKDVVATIGGYIGTYWVEEEVLLNALYLKGEMHRTVVDCPFERTKNGYFILDISNLPVGRYYVDDRVIDIVY